MELSQIQDIKRRLKHMSLGQIFYHEDGSYTVCVLRKIPNPKGAHLKWNRVCVATGLINPSGHIDEIHFHKKYDSRELRFRCITQLLVRDWVMDMETKLIITYSKYNKKSGKHEKFSQGITDLREFIG